ncbi:MAG: hypothetical protein U0992_10035 [Planctomycetaceae bacterium]
MADDEVIEELVQVNGIGVWTMQMFLIFSLGRPDVLPHGDFGVRAAIRNLYALDELPNREQSFAIAEPWRPYASIAAWYCWRSLDNNGRRREPLMNTNRAPIRREPVSRPEGEAPRRAGVKGKPALHLGSPDWSGSPLPACRPLNC